MYNFKYTGLPARVIFGAGTVENLPEELDRLNINKALILTTPFQKEQGEYLFSMLGNRAAGLCTLAEMHTPIATTEKALQIYSKLKADGLIAIGGGSTIGLGKAIALRTDAPQIVLPTSFAGSEMTTIIGQTDSGRKTTQKTLKVLPETVIYDVNFTLTLPTKMAVMSGLNAIAHAVESLYAEEPNPILSLIAEDGIAKMARALKQISNNPEDLEPRSEALYGAWLCATCLGSGGVALHHKLCHVLGGSFNLPHAETHTVILPHAIAYNASHIPDAMKAMRRATGADMPAAAFFDIAKSASVPISLKELGMPKDSIAKAIRITLENPYYNPRPLEQNALHELLTNAWQGTRPNC